MVLIISPHYQTQLITMSDDDELFLTDERCLALFPTGTIARDPHHRESLTRRQQDLNLRKSWVQTLLNELAK